MMKSSTLLRLRRRPPGTDNATAIHEANFEKLARVIPCLQDLTAPRRLYDQQQHRLDVRLLETSPFTRTYALQLQHQASQPWLLPIHMKIRNYYDARVTEVLAFQQHYRLAARYPYPNPAMLQRNEKWQINHFLGEWLDHCLKSRSIFGDQATTPNPS